jgi:CBS domain-containing protein
MEPWMSPLDRYYYTWYAPETTVGTPVLRTDREIKSEVVERLRRNPFTKEHTLRVDVKNGVVVVQGSVASRVAKRSAGDDCWDVEGVADVSNQLQVTDVHAASEPLDEVMSRGAITIPKDSSLPAAAWAMHDNDVGFLVITDDGGALSGVITDRDIVTRAVAGVLPATATVADVCTHDVVSAPSSYRPTDLASLMVWSAVRRIPVVDDGRVVGVVSLGDLARHLDPGSALANICAAPRDA